MKIRLMLVAAATAALTACGGGSDAPATTSTTPPTITPTVTTKIAGTAAVGAALPNATVQIKCATGSGTATTAADGTFSVSIDNAVRPCVLSVATPSGTTLHSVLEAGTGTAAVANITPLTELITASLAGGDTAAFFASFDAQAQAKLSTQGLSTAIDSVKLILTGLVDIAGMDPLKDTLVAANGSTPGNALDQRLDTLGTVLTTARTTLADLSTAVASNTGSTDGIKLILQPASSTCAALRSGKYQKVDLTGNTIQRFTMDAVTLSRTNDSTSTAEQFQPFESQACRFGNTAARLMVAKSSIALERRAGAPSLLIPDQTVPLSEFAGDWIAMAYERDDSATPYNASLLRFTLDSTGKATSAADCNLTGCSDPWPAAELFAVTVNANGGFDLTDSNGSARAFGFKGVDGQLSMVIVHGGGFMVAKRPVARALPAVGFVNAFWDASLNAQGVTDITEHSITVTSNDPVANTYTRQREDGRIDTWYDNLPSNGLRYRKFTPAVNGLESAAEAIGMSLPGTGLAMAISVNPAEHFFTISVDRP